MPKIPLPHIIQTDDGALCFEWFGENCRAMLHLEQDPNQSGWHFVSKMSVGGEMFCEELSKMNVNKFIECIMRTAKEKTMEKKYGFKIDLPKWKAAEKALLDKREEERAKTEKKYWASLDYFYDEQLTKLYSIRAHSRGRIHRKYAYLNWSDWKKLPISANKLSYDDFNNSNGQIKFELSLEDQAAYIGDSWKQYAIETPVENITIPETKPEEKPWWKVWK